MSEVEEKHKKFLNEMDERLREYLAEDNSSLDTKDPTRFSTQEIPEKYSGIRTNKSPEDTFNLSDKKLTINLKNAPDMYKAKDVKEFIKSVKNNFAITCPPCTEHEACLNMPCYDVLQAFIKTLDKLAGNKLI